MSLDKSACGSKMSVMSHIEEEERRGEERRGPVSLDKSACGSDVNHASAMRVTK